MIRQALFQRDMLAVFFYNRKRSTRIDADIFFSEHRKNQSPQEIADDDDGYDDMNCIV